MLAMIREKTHHGEQAELLAAHEFDMLLRIKDEACAPLPIEKLAATLRLDVPNGILLSDWLKGSRSFEERLQAVLALTKALSKVHAKGIVYRNISLRHVLVDPDSEQGFRAIWLNFERATRLSRLKQVVTQPSQLKGELAYFSPELTGRINRVVDWRSDLYGLGVLYYQIFTDQLPFVAETPIEWVNAHLSQHPAPLNDAELPPKLVQILMTLLAKNPEQRYASIRGLIYDLERLAKGERGFDLREHDYAQSFALPDKLYGRDLELATLESLLEQIHGTLQFVAIAAPSGMGKTALVEELRRTMSRKEALLCSGKFDQYAQGEPFSALAQAIDELARQVLAWDTESFVAWRKKLLKSLNGNGRLLTDLSPMMERILGEQPPLPEIDVERAAIRMAETFFGFFAQCASAEHPVIMFIDDLQWVDSATLSVLEMLKERAGSLRHLLMIHAFRSNELVKDCPYDRWLQQVGARHIDLEPLGESAVTELLSDGFSQRIAPSELVALARLLDGRSGGSPFYLRELIASLIDKEAIRLDTDKGQWHFDAAVAAKIEFSADVAELLLAKIEDLSPEAQNALSLMSFIGREFSLDNLMRCAEIGSTQQAAQILWPAIELDLIAPLNEGFQLLLVSDHDAKDFSCRFVHDKVQAASQSRLPEAQRTLVKEKIAFNLLSDRDPLSLEREAIVLADLLAEATLEGDRAVSRRRLRLRAGMMTRRSGQIPRARKFLEDAWHFDDAWQEPNLSDTYKIMEELADTHRTNADLEALVDLDIEVDRLIEDKLKASPVVHALLQTYCSNQQMAEAIARYKQFNVALDYPAVYSGSPLRLVISYLYTKVLIGNPRRTLANADAADDRTQELFTGLTNAGTAIIADAADTFPLIICDLMRLAVRNGVPLGFGTTALAAFSIVAKVFGDHVLAKDYLDAVSIVSKRSGPVIEAADFMFRNVYMESSRVTKLTPEAIARAYQHTEVLIRNGTLEIGAGILNGLRIYALNSGQSLRTFRELYAENYPQFHLPGRNYVERYKKIYKQTVAASLAQSLDDEVFACPSEDEDLAAKAEYYNTLTVWNTILGKAMLPAHQSARRRFEDAIIGQPSSDRAGAYYEIACLRYGTPRLSTAKDRLMDRIKRFAGWMAVRKLAKIGAEPFVPLAHLVKGTKAEMRGRKSKALWHYEQCYAAAGAAGTAREQMMAADYLVRLHRSSNREACLVWLQRLLSAAEEYSFMPKLVAIREEFSDDIKELYALFPQLKESQVESKVSDDLDLATLIQAGSDLAEAKDLSGLVHKALEIVVKNLSATRAHLWQTSGGSWTRLGGEGDVSAEFLDEIYRAQEMRVIDDASDSELSCQSALIMPMASGGQSIGLMVIENETLTEAFPRSRLPFLRTLSSQIATAIANALLYAQMEEKVQEKARAMVAIMTHIEQGILTIEANGKIAEDFSAALPQILGIAQIAGRDAIEIMFHQADLATDVVDQVEATLSSSLGEDVLNFEVNIDRLVKELTLRNGKIIELDWVPITDDHDEVRSIMVTLRDVTQVRASQAAAEASAQELRRIGSLLALSPRQSTDFFEDARTRLEASKARVEESADPSRWLELNFRDLHTLKGVSRSYQFLDLAALIHEVEEPYQSARQHSHSQESLLDTAALSAALADLLVLVGDYERIEVEVLRRQGAGAMDIAALRVAAAKRDWTSFDALLVEDGFLDLEVLLAPVLRSLPALAEELGRPAPNVSFDIRSSALDQSWGTTLLGALTHVLRNSVDHGLKTAASGDIRLEVSETSSAVVIVVEDAGRGLNLATLQKKLGDVSDEDLAEAIFQSGLSTNEHVSDVSGRGVGMDAVRAAIEERGGNVEVQFVSNERDGEGYRKHRLLITIPRDAQEAAA